jgi:hypothetical protein
VYAAASHVVEGIADSGGLGDYPPVKPSLLYAAPCHQRLSTIPGDHLGGDLLAAAAVVERPLDPTGRVVHHKAEVISRRHARLNARHIIEVEPARGGRGKWT